MEAIIKNQKGNFWTLSRTEDGEFIKTLTFKQALSLSKGKDNEVDDSVVEYFEPKKSEKSIKKEDDKIKAELASRFHYTTGFISLDEAINDIDPIKRIVSAVTHKHNGMGWIPMTTPNISYMLANGTKEIIVSKLLFDTYGLPTEIRLKR